MSTTMIQLNPPIPLETSKGKGFAHVMIDYGPEYDLLWVVFMDATGECWCVRNAEVRMQKNWSLGRVGTSPIQALAPGSAPTPPGERPLSEKFRDRAAPPPETNGHALNGHSNGHAG